MLEHKADPEKEQKDDEDEMDLNGCLAKIKDDMKFGASVMRSGRIRKAANFLPENSVKSRKSYYCTAETGYFHQKVKFN